MRNEVEMNMNERKKAMRRCLDAVCVRVYERYRAKQSRRISFIYQRSLRTMILGNSNHPNRIPNPMFLCVCVRVVRYYFQTFYFVVVLFCVSVLVCVHNFIILRCIHFERSNACVFG